MAAAKKAPPPSSPGPRLVMRDGKWVAYYEHTAYRFLLDDGRTVDVVAARDDSDLRAAVLERTGATRIEGVARVGADAEAKQEREP
jgi:hypothetical protein